MYAISLETTLESIMRTPIQAVGVETPVVDALLLCEMRGVHHLPLFERGMLVGVVCMCDLEELRLDAPVGSALHRPPIVMEATAQVSDAVRCMSEEIVGSVLVMRCGDPVGIVTREDALRAANDDGDYRCETCGARAHFDRRRTRALLCRDCGSRAHPALPDDELGGSE